MSQYLIIKQKVNGKFYPVASFSRSTIMYEAFDHYVSYGKGKLLTQDLIDCAHNQLQLDEKHVGDIVKSIGKQIERVSSFNNSIDEKFELINELTAETRDFGERLVDIEHARAQLNLLSDMIVEAKYCEGDAPEYFIGIEWGTEISD